MYSVVIAGRPNVGKSTLFNRLINKKRAITDPTSGVTRDVISQECYFSDYKVLLSDTGGIKDAEDTIDAQVRKKSLSMLKSCDVILFLVDWREWTAEDDEITQFIRPFSDKVILVVNKIDDPKHDNAVWNFHELGFSRVVGISSSHGRGIDSLEEYVVSALSEKELLDPNSALDDESEEESDDKKRICISIMGKPNTGKSTLTNALCNENLSIVSPVAGTTRDTIDGFFEYKDYQFKITDTAGLRRKSKVEEDIEYYSVNRAIKSIDDADIVVLVIDSLDGVSEQDKKIASLIVRQAKGVILCINKIDKLTIKNQFEAIVDRTRFLFPVLSFAPIVGISAMEKKGLDKLLDSIIMVKKELERRINTADFNAAIKKWNEIYTPPRTSKGYYKILYGTQVEQSPVRFLLFVNKKTGFPEGYLSFIKNKIRKDFGFAHIPININLRERERTNDALADAQQKRMAKWKKKKA